MKAIYSCTGAMLAILAGAAIFRPQALHAGPGSATTVNSASAPAAVTRADSAPKLNSAATPGSAASPTAGSPAASADQKIRLADNYGKLPLGFEANQGQTDSRVKFLSRGRGYSLFLTGDEAVLTLGSTSQNAKGKSQKAKVEVGIAPTGAGSDPARSAYGSVAPTLRSAYAGLKSGATTAHAGPMSGGSTAIDDPPPTAHEPRKTDSILRMKLVGANASAAVTGADELPGKSNYFIGNDPKKWRTNVPTYAKVKYQGVYPGVDLVYYGNQGGQLEYDFVVAPGANPGAIKLDVGAGLALPSVDRDVGTRQSAVGSTNTKRSAQAVTAGSSRHPNVGAVREPPTVAAGLPRHPDMMADRDSPTVAAVSDRRSPVGTPALQKRAHRDAPLQIAADGDLVVKTDGGEVRFHKPLVYQPTTNTGPRTSDLGLRTRVEGNFVLQANNQVGFEVPSYDHTRPLIIDPVLSYSTYLGGSSYNYADAIAVDSSGNAYVTGYTQSTDFPTANPLQASNNASNVTAFVTKFNAAGSVLLYSTYLGGTHADLAKGIAVDPSGNAYVTGYTLSPDFPTVNPFQANCGGIAPDCSDAFVAKLNDTGSALVYSTYLGGSGGDVGYGITADAAGNAYVTGSAGSTDFPTANPIHGGNCANHIDTFVAKLNAAGSALVYSTCLGGANDVGRGIAVDSSGNAYVTGNVSLSGLPTVNPLQATDHGSDDAFVFKLNAAGSALVYSTYLGGSNTDIAFGIAADAAGNAYVTGYTISTDFPTASPFQATCNGCSRDNTSAFVSKLNADGSALVYSTYLGGTDGEVGYSIAADPSGNAFVAGFTASTDFPIVNAIQPTYGGGGGGGDAFVTEFNATGSALVYSTYLGGRSTDYALGIAVDSSGNAYVTGIADSLDFPTANPLQAIWTGVSDGFVAKISAGGVLPPISFSPTNLTFGPQLVGTVGGSRTETVTNNGTGNLTISTVMVGGADASDYATSADACTGATLTPTSTCTVSVTFTPSAMGSRSASLNFTDNAANSPQVVSLTGAGILPTLVITASSASMTYGGAVPAITPSYAGFMNGDTAASLTTAPTCSTTATNSSPVGSYPSTCSGAVDANYTISYTAGNVTIGPAPLTITAPSTTINVGASIPSFTPTYNGFVNGQTAGSLTTQPTCTTTATNASPAGMYPITCSGAVDANYNIGYVAGTLTIAGTGTGGVASLAPGNLTFSVQPVGMRSAALTETVTNTGTGNLTISAATLGGANAGDFAKSADTCSGATLTPSSACTVSVTFTPSAAGSRNASLIFTDSASNSPQAVALSGTGVQGVVLNPTTLTFGNQSRNTTSPTRVVKLANTSTTALAISVTTSGDFAQTNTCGGSVPARSTCTISVTFAPTIIGLESGTLTVTDAAANSPQTAALSGRGVM